MLEYLSHTDSARSLLGCLLERKKHFSVPLKPLAFIPKKAHSRVDKCQTDPRLQLTTPTLHNRFAELNSKWHPGKWRRNGHSQQKTHWRWPRFALRTQHRRILRFHHTTWTVAICVGVKYPHLVVTHWPAVVLNSSWPNQIAPPTCPAFHMPGNESRLCNTTPLP